MRLAWFIILIFVATNGACSFQSQIPRCHSFREEVFRWRSIDFPIPVHISEASSYRIQKAIVLAIDAWNNATGRNVFILVDDMQVARIAFDEADLPCNPVCVVGLTYKDYIGDTIFIRSSSIYLKEVRNFEYLKKNAIHELGHALGLNHDCSTRSIMYHSAASSDGILMPDDIMYIQWQMMQNF